MFHQNEIKDNENHYLNTFIYKLTQCSITKLDCYSFAFNKNSTILFIGCAKGRIKIYGFNNKFKQVQTLQSIIDVAIFEIFFLKKSNELVTSSHVSKNNIVIWNLDRNNFWSVKQSWNAHSKLLNCLIINKEEDMLISGSVDKTIKFWENKPLGWICSQTIDAQIWISCLGLNFSSTKLIASGVLGNILVIEFKPTQQWMITQKIEVNNSSQLGFINDNSFIFQLFGRDFLEIYNYDQERKQFHKYQQMKLLTIDVITHSLSRPIEVKREKNILKVSHNLSISFLRINLDGEYILQQQIKFNGDRKHQRLEDNAQYLVSWEEQQARIQIRKLLIFE